MIHRRRTATAPGVLAAATTIDGYRIERLIGRGGMGTVYEATQLSLNRRVAFKVIDPSLAADPTLRKRFRREGPLQAGIDHPHILPVYEAGESGDYLFIAMQLVRGQTLKGLIVSGELSPSRTFDMLADVAAALDAAHAAGLVHRDVKPQNVLVAGGDHAYLADFGLSKTMGDETLTRSGQFLGSVHYVAPEQVRGETVTAASDVYSFTGMLFECLTGLVPFPRDGEVGVLWAHLSDSPPWPSEIRPELPRELDPVIERGMAKQPGDRYASAGAVVRAAEAATGTEPRPRMRDDGAPTIPNPAVGPVAAPPSLAPTRTHRRPAFALALSVLLLIGAAVAGYLVERQPAARDARRVSVSNGQVRLTPPDGWTRVAPAHRPAGIRLSSPVELEPSGGGRGLVFGTAAHGTTGSGVPQIVRLGGAEGYRWTGTSPRALYVVPTTERWAVVGCLAGGTACDNAARTVRLHGLKPVPAAPDPAYGKGVTATMRALDTTRSAAMTALLKASTSTDQANAYGHFREAYRAAALKLSSLDPPVAARPSNAAIRTALADTSRGFDALASAAGRQDHAAYRAARREVGQSEITVRQALARLNSLGYHLGTGP